MKLAVLNTSILTNPRQYSLKDIALETAQQLVKENEILTAVGHKSTADILITYKKKVSLTVVHNPLLLRLREIAYTGGDKEGE
ncbi:MAG TPA: hypothetical protein DDZ91_12030 [Firmicutes bacterium]|jgi:hypothetical protein|nr:hypothetical protein [Bacillota bacterium]